MTPETRSLLDLLGDLRAEAAAVSERVEAGGPTYGAGGDLLADLERIRRILTAIDAIARDPVA